MLIDRNYHQGPLWIPKAHLTDCTSPLTEPTQGIRVENLEQALAYHNNMTIYSLISPTDADVDFLIKGLLVIKVRNTQFRDTELDEILLYGRHVDLRSDWANTLEIEYKDWYQLTFNRQPPYSFLDMNDLAHFELFYFHKTAGATYKFC